jgi:hypothetical protein
MNCLNEQTNDYSLNACYDGGYTQNEAIELASLFQGIDQLRALGWEINQTNYADGSIELKGQLGKHQFRAWALPVRKEVAA